MSDAILSTWTIYDHPIDAPNHVVVRRWRVMPGGGDPVGDEHLARFDTLDEAREWLAAYHPGLYCIARQPADDPKIVETWL